MIVKTAISQHNEVINIPPPAGMEPESVLKGKMRMNPTSSKPSLGVIFHPTFPPESLPDFARKAEAGGFDELWLWDDCFLPGTFTAAAIALSATERLKVGIGLLPATVYHPLFAAMEITTLASAFPGRILPGFGYGVQAWMSQIGAAPASYMKALEETVESIRALLGGQTVTRHGSHVKMDDVQMQTLPAVKPPLLIGAKREKTLRLSGRIADGTILVYMSSPEYIRWARDHIRAGMAESGRTEHRLVVYTAVKVSPDGRTAREAVRQDFTLQLPWVDVQIRALGIADEVNALTAQYGKNGFAEHMPDEWIDRLAAAGTPEQAEKHIRALADAGADSVIFQPLHGDPDCLDEYIQYLMPRLKRKPIG